MNTELKSGVRVIMKRDNGVWYKKNDTGTIIKFEHRKSGKEYWVVEVRNSQFTICETDLEVSSVK